MTARTLLPILVASAPALAQSPDATETVSYHGDILPLLRARCHGCHQPARAKGGVDLTNHELVTELLTPGAPHESELLEVVLPSGDDPPAMPARGEPLTELEVALLTSWISEGAKDDSPAGGPAYSGDRPPVYEQLPVVTSLAFSPDGQWLAVSGYHEVLLHRTDTYRSANRLVGMSERIESLAFSPDGTRLAVAGGSPGRMGELQVWGVENGTRLLLSVPVTHDTIYGVSWSPDGSRVAFGCGDSTLRAIDAKTGEEVLYQGAHEDWVLDTAWSTDASHLVSVSRDRSMKLVQVDTEQFIDNITSITPGALKGGLMSVDRHPERDELLVGGADGVPKVFRMYREKKRVIGDDFNLIRAFEALPGRVFDVDWSSDGSRIAAASSARDSGEVRACKAEDGTTLWTLETPAGMFAVDHHPSTGVIAAAGFDGIVRRIDGETGEILSTFPAVPLSSPRETQ